MRTLSACFMPWAVLESELGLRIATADVADCCPRLALVANAYAKLGVRNRASVVENGSAMNIFCGCTFSVYSGLL